MNRSWWGRGGGEGGPLSYGGFDCRNKNTDSRFRRTNFFLNLFDIIPTSPLSTWQLLPQSLQRQTYTPLIQSGDVTNQTPRTTMAPSSDQQRKLHPLELTDKGVPKKSLTSLGSSLYCQTPTYWFFLKKMTWDLITLRSEIAIIYYSRRKPYQSWFQNQHNFPLQYSGPSPSSKYAGIWYTCNRFPIENNVKMRVNLFFQMMRHIVLSTATFALLP